MRTLHCMEKISRRCVSFCHTQHDITHVSHAPSQSYHSENIHRDSWHLVYRIEAFTKMFIWCIHVYIYSVYLEDELAVLLQQLLEGVGLGLDDGLERLPLLVQLVLQRVDDLQHHTHPTPKLKHPFHMRPGPI